MEQPSREGKVQEVLKKDGWGEKENEKRTVIGTNKAREKKLKGGDERRTELEK